MTDLPLYRTKQGEEIDQLKARVAELEELVELAHKQGQSSATGRPGTDFRWEHSGACKLLNRTEEPRDES